MVAQIDWTRVFQLLTIVFIVEFSIHPVIGGCPFGHGKEHASHGEGIQEVQRHTSHVHTHDHQAEHSHHGHKHNHVGHSHIHEHKHAHDHEVSRGAVDSSRLRPAEEIAEERELLLGKDYDHFDDYDHFYETGQGGDLVPPARENLGSVGGEGRVAYERVVHDKKSLKKQDKLRRKEVKKKRKEEKKRSREEVQLVKEASRRRLKMMTVNPFLQNKASPGRPPHSSEKPRRLMSEAPPTYRTLQNG